MPASALTLDNLPEPRKSQIVSASTLSLHLNQSPKGYYQHGWQSWSLTAWTDPSHRPPVMKPTSFHNRQTDPVYARYPQPNGSWLGAVELAPDDIVLLGALGLEAHVALRQNQLQGWYETGTGDWFIARGNECDVFALYADLLGQHYRKEGRKAPPRVWCSWYSLYDSIREASLLEILNDLADLPFDVFQIDDGWQRATGDWEPNDKFPSGMNFLAEKIKASGRKAGLWLAPLTVGKSSRIYTQHPDWLLRDPDGKLQVAGFEWGMEVFAVDTTHPEAIEWLRSLIRKVRSWGFEYLKLDFLFAGALPGKRYVDTPRETAYRQALQVMREAAGDTYLLLCGTPILPSLGLCDAIRIGPDVSDKWDSRFYSYYLYNQTSPGLQNAIRTNVNRLWLRPLTNVDPDVAFFSENAGLSAEQRQIFVNLTEICGVKATSDLPGLWSTPQRSAVHQWLERSPAITRTGRYTFTIDGRQVDFGPAITLPPLPGFFDNLLGEFLGCLGNQSGVLKLWHRFLRHRRPK